MNRIEELIAAHAPNGVHMRPLGAIATVQSGWGFPNVDQGTTNGEFPFYKVSDMNSPTNRITMSVANNYISADTAQRLGIKPAPAGTVIFPKIGAAVATNKKRILSAPSAFDNNVMGLIPGPDIASRFLFYWMQTFDLSRLANDSGAMPSIRKSEAERLRVPVPPLEVQREIVRILDQFTELEAELKAELEARRQQYDFYRDHLLTFSIDVPQVALGDLGSIFGGLAGKSKADFSNGNARFASYRNVFSNISLDTKAADFVHVATGERQRSLEYGDVIFTGSSESLAEVGMTSAVTERLTEPLYLNSFCIGFRPKDVQQLNPEFAKHLFRSTSMRDQIKKTASGVTRINISKARLAKILVPFPDPVEQLRMAGVLDRLYALANDLNVGLPAELSARRKQYEYYRDRLLTFEEASA